MIIKENPNQQLEEKVIIEGGTANYHAQHFKVNIGNTIGEMEME